MSDKKASFKELVEAISSLDIQDAIIKNIIDLPPEKLVVICDLAEKLSGKNGGQWLVAFKEFINQKSHLVDVYKGNVLRLISGGQNFIIDAVNGTETLVNAKDTFDYIEKNEKISNSGGLATEETPVEVYEMRQCASWPTMFSELNADFRKLCFTQHQIKNFVIKYRQHLHLDEGRRMVFLFEEGQEILVAAVSYQYKYINERDTWDGRHLYDVEYIPGKLCLSFGHSQCCTTWNPMYPPKVVVPKAGVSRRF